MVAQVTKQSPQVPSPREQKRTRYDSVCEWRMVNHFNTLEDAERAVEELRNEGLDAELSLSDGLCVVVPRRAPECDPSLS